MASLPKLMLVTDRHICRGDLVDVLKEAVDAGLRFIQLRENNLPNEDLSKVASRLSGLHPDLMVSINSNLAVASGLRAGLHLPSRLDVDHIPTSVRFVGRSIHSVERCQTLRKKSVDYLLLGTIFKSSCKPGKPPEGLQLIRDVKSRVANVPIFAIGGISAHNAPSTLRAGAYGVAVRSAILASSSPGRATETLLHAIHIV